MDSLAKIEKKELDKKKRQGLNITIGGLERLLCEIYPPEDSIDGDRCGLLVGDRNQELKKVAVALDPTYDAFLSAKQAGANVLLTHHPLFLTPVEGFHPFDDCMSNGGSLVYEAISLGVASMNFHTTLDVSEDAQNVLPTLLHLNPVKGSIEKGSRKYKARILQPISSSKKKGFGQVCVPDNPLSLRELAGRATAVFGRAPRVWGDLNKKIEVCVTATGSASSLIEDALMRKVDCIVAGEFKYHDALYASSKGLGVIDLGHDTTEIPLAAVLANACKKCGIDSSRIILLDQSHNWQYCDAIRI